MLYFSFNYFLWKPIFPMEIVNINGQFAISTGNLTQ